MTRFDIAKQLILAAQTIAVRKTCRAEPTAEPRFPSDPAFWIARYRLLKARP